MGPAPRSDLELLGLPSEPGRAGALDPESDPLLDGASEPPSDETLV